MIMSFECRASDKFRVAVDNYLHPKSLLLSLTDHFFVENKAHYYKMKDGNSLVLIVENGVFDIVAQYVAVMGASGFLFALLSGVRVWGSILWISLVLVLVSLAYLSGKFRFYLLRWRIHRVVDRRLEMRWLSKEQTISRFIFGVEEDGSA